MTATCEAHLGIRTLDNPWLLPHPPVALEVIPALRRDHRPSPPW